MIAIITGTRAELIKTFPVMLELEKKGKEYVFINTGQHNLKNLCEQFGIREPDFILSKEPKGTTKFYQSNRKIIIWSLSIIQKLKRLLRNLGPEYVIYHGDTGSTMAAALASSKFLNPEKKWKNVHLEAGLRSGCLLEPFPEEIIRIVADRFSDILFVPSKRCEKNVKKYKGKKIICVGNSIVDSATIAYKLARKKKIKKLTRKRYALISVHRNENLKSKERMRKIVKIINTVSIQAFWTMHDNTKLLLSKFELLDKIHKNIKVVKPMNYIEFIYHLANADFLLTDGGSIQEESLVFKKPCVILRKYTERQEGLSTGINFLTKLNVDYAKKIIRDIEEGKVKVKKFKNPYGEERVSKIVVNLLMNQNEKQKGVYNYFKF